MQKCSTICKSRFSDMQSVFQSTFAASPCLCRLWWRTPAAAASTAPSPLTMTSTPTPSSSSPASSATVRGTSRGPARSSSGGIVFDTKIRVNGAIYYHSQAILNPQIKIIFSSEFFSLENTIILIFFF